MNTNKIDLSWGNAQCVRSAFTSRLKNKNAAFEWNDRNLDYPPHFGDEKLIDITRNLIERYTGQFYSNIFITNGAMGGITIALRAYAQQGYQTALTRPAPYFPVYPTMIEATSLKMAHVENIFDLDLNTSEVPVVLWDSPGNPLGDVMENMRTRSPVIWDAVYHNNIYMCSKYEPIKCDVLVGSYSKLLGLSGLRVGWIATNDDLLAVRLKNLITAEYAGLSTASNLILLGALNEYNEYEHWETFEREAKENLDDNRTEWAKLERYFGGQGVSPNGMFYFTAIDDSCKKLI